jgi:hypothetical protein
LIFGGFHPRTVAKGHLERFAAALIDQIGFKYIAEIQRTHRLTAGVLDLRRAGAGFNCGGKSGGNAVVPVISAKEGAEKSNVPTTPPRKEIVFIKRFLF